jgi:hypothetical protein
MQQAWARSCSCSIGRHNTCRILQVKLQLCVKYREFRVKKGIATSLACKHRNYSCVRRAVDVFIQAGRHTWFELHFNNTVRISDDHVLLT